MWVSQTNLVLGFFHSRQEQAYLSKGDVQTKEPGKGKGQDLVGESPLPPEANILDVAVDGTPQLKTEYHLRLLTGSVLK